MSFLDNVNVDESQTNITVDFPFVQWYRGSLQGKGPLATGAFEVNQDRWGNLLQGLQGLDEFSQEIMSPMSDHTRQSWLFEKLSIAPLQTVQLWSTTDWNNNRRTETYYENYVPGASGKYRVLGVIEEFWEVYKGLTWITVTGVTGKYMKKAHKSFQTNVISAAPGLYNKGLKAENQIGRLPEYTFWMRLQATGKKITVGTGDKKNYITPMEHIVPQFKTAEDLGKLYVGDEIFQFCQSNWDLGVQWLEYQLELAKTQGPGAQAPKTPDQNSSPFGGQEVEEEPFPLDD